MLALPALADAPGIAGLASLTGRWERTLLRNADGTVDTMSRVTWLQGPSLYVDLRLPPGAPVDGPGEGFAGRLTRDGRVFTWTHEVELGRWPGADSATLAWDNECLAERGVHAGYLENWRLAASRAAGAACWGLRLARQGGQRAVLVRVGNDVGWACGPAAREVSLARVTGPCAAHVTQSSDPSRLGCQLTWSDTVGAVLMAIQGPAGTIRTRWQVTDREGTE